MVKSYEQDKGILSEANFENKENLPGIKTSHQSFLDYMDSMDKEILIEPPNMESIIHENSSSSSATSVALSSRNKILLNTSLNPNFHRKKYEFYSLSDQINDVQCFEWDDQYRVPVKISSKSLEELNEK